MQELSISIKQRIAKAKQIVQQNVNSDIIRFLRQQEKIRCQKQNFILAMMRANKIMSVNLKKSYFRISYQLMTLLQQSFQYKQGWTIEEDFLNQFVHLYTSFFAYFETKFTFKTKIKNFLRPTNHNLIVDLIKYFVQFTRDYYVQILFWKMKNSNKHQNLGIQNSLNIQENANQKNLSKVKKIGSFCRNFSTATDVSQISISARKKTDQAQQKRSYQSNYQILDIVMPSIFINNPKQNYINLNIESLKIKINQLFRDQKSRNSAIKKINDEYLVQYGQKYSKPFSTILSMPYLSAYKRSDHINLKCKPFKMLLSVQKNGFSFILIEIDYLKNKNSILSQSNKIYSNSNITSLNSSPVKISTQNSLSPLKITQRVSQGQQIIKSDYLLTSMKVLRVSQNFLPPLMNSNINLINDEASIKKQGKIQKQGQRKQSSLIPFSLKLKRMTDQVEQQIPFKNQISNSNNVLVRSTSYKKSSSQKQKRKQQNYNNQIYSGDYIGKRQYSENKQRNIEQENYHSKLSNKKLNSKKKFIQDKRNYNNGTYFPVKLNSKSASSGGYESEQKILQWLQKIKNLKEIQRKKILGMNF